MTLKNFTDRVKMLTTTTSTTSPLVLSTAVAQFQAATAGMDGLLCDYILTDVDGAKWEVGQGVYTHSGTTLARTTIKASSNSGSAISLSATGSTVIFGPSAQDEASNYAMQRGFIRGGILDDATNTTISCTAVSVFIESANRVYDFAAPSNLTITVGASAVGHVYIDTAGALSDSTTAPVLFATRAAGNARSKSGDTSKRYLGSFITDGSSHIIPFTMYDLGGGQAEVDYTLAGAGAAPYRIVSAGAATSYGSISTMVGIVPASVAVQALIQMTQTQTGAPNIVSLSTDGTNDNALTFIGTAATSFSAMTGWSPIAPSTPGIYYKVNNVANTVYIDVAAYRFVR